jgi:hypothetical protein
MTIGEPPLEPLLAPRATARSSVPDFSGGQTVRNCVVVASRSDVGSEDPTPSRERPHWLTYMASLFRCQGAAARHAPETGRAPHVDRFAAPTPPPVRFPLGDPDGQVTEARP